MEENLKYKRILLKLSGEALLGEQQFGIDQNPLEMIANEVKQAYDLGAEIAIVVGGGNIFRGVKNSAKYGMDQATGDYIGFLDSDDWIDNNFLLITRRSHTNQ